MTAEERPEDPTEAVDSGVAQRAQTEPRAPIELEDSELNRQTERSSVPAPSRQVRNDSLQPGVLQISSQSLLGSAPRVSISEPPASRAYAPGSVPPPPALPERFEIRSVLGRGGMGVVYRVYDREMRHEVALKALYGISPEDRLRLKHEFRTLRNVIHPNLVTLHELVLDEHFSFFTMELVRGRHLNAYLRQALEQCSDTEQRSNLVRNVAGQLAQAVHAVHSAASVHRDIKPSNVMVTKDERVVLLDFGLTVQTLASHGVNAMEEIAGTVLYMAPEQLWQNAASPASDWYAFGVTLFEAISGKLPLRPELRTSRDSAPRLREQGIGLDPALDTLFSQLLSFREAARPSGSEVLESLGRTERTSTPYSWPQSKLGALLGRETLLAELQTVLQAPARGVPHLVSVVGASGMGKSSLVHAAVKQFSREQRALVLRSRCHPQEAIAFNALDGLVDDLSSAIEGILRGSERSLSPEEHYAITAIFPELNRCLELPALPLEQVPARADLRPLAARAFATLLGRAAEQFRVIAWIDDAQWGDEDSGIFLRTLLHDRNCPPCTVVISYRAEDAQQGAFLRLMRQDELIWPARSAFEVGALSTEDSYRILRAELGADTSVSESQLENWVRASDGSPFFLGELARCVTQFQLQLPSESAAGIENILTLRTRSLPELPRRLLEVLAVAGAPLEPGLVIAAASASPEAHGWLNDLERLKLLRTTEVGHRRVEFYHHRLRDAVLVDLDAAKRRSLHAAIAEALLRTEVPNPLAALDHFEAAEDVEAIRRHVVEAASFALRGLAFERAARLFSRAIQLQSPERPVHELYTYLGEALSRTGQGKPAGEAFLAAAAALEAANGSRDSVIQLTQKAAEQFIQTGYFEPGMQALGRVTESLGIPLPKTQKEALKKATLLRARRLLTSTTPRLRSKPASPAQLWRFNVLWAANVRLAQVDFALSSYLTARCVDEALKLGDASCIIRSLAADATRWLQLPGKLFAYKARRITEVIEALCETHGTVVDRASVLGNRAMTAFFNGNFAELVSNGDLAIETLRTLGGAERHWEENVWDSWCLVGLTHLGELRKLVARSERVLEAARRRDDRLMILNASVGRGATAWLVKDQPDTLIQQADRALTWAPPGYTLQLYLHFISTTEARVYMGAEAEAYKLAREAWKQHEAGSLLRVRFFRDSLLHVRARAALAYASNAATGPSLREELQNEVETLALEMGRHGLPPAKGWSELLLGALAEQRGQPAAARARIESAIGIFTRNEMRHYVETARFLHARFEDADSAPATRASSDAWFAEQGVLNPNAFRHMLAPGYVH